MKMIDMSRDEDSLPCCDYNSKYPIGFFLSPEHVEKLGLKDLKPEQEIKIQATICVSSVTERKDQSECYVHIKEMGVMSSKMVDPKMLMSKEYEGESDGE